MWDVDAAVAELEWAHEAGLKAVNFPAMRDGSPRVQQAQLGTVVARARNGRYHSSPMSAATNANYSGLESVALLQWSRATSCQGGRSGG